MISCEQFDIRVQDLMDQRLELSTDSLIQEHASHCSRCQGQLDSFLSLEDSFSGKIPASYFRDIEPNGRPKRNRMAGWLPLAVTLSLGVLIGVTLANLDRFRSPSGEMATIDRRMAPHHAASGNDGSDAKVALAASESPSGGRDSGAASAASPFGADPSTDNTGGGRGMGLANANRIPLISLEQFRRSYPTLDLYYRLSDELPGIRTIKDSFRVAWEWVERGLPFDPFESN